MTDDIDVELDDVQNSLAEKATAIIDESTDWVTLARELDVSRYQYGDSHPDWRTVTPFRPMLLAYLWSEVEDEPLGPSAHASRMTQSWRQRSGLTRTIYFGGDVRPCRVTDRFDTPQRIVEYATDTSRDVSAQRGAPIGYDLGKVETDEEDGEPSNRTVQRLLQRRT